MFFDLATKHTNFVIMIESILNNNFDEEIKQLSPKLQLYIIKGLFSLLKDENILSFSTKNIKLLYDILNILLRNYIRPQIYIKNDEQYIIRIPSKDTAALRFFIFNENINILYSMRNKNLSGINFPIYWNNKYYMKYNIKLKSIYISEEPQVAVKIITKDNIPFQINTIIIK